VTKSILELRVLHCRQRYAVVLLVEALRYKPEGRGFDFLLGISDLLLTYSHRPRTFPVG
jgi:hypothetical protein